MLTPEPNKAVAASSAVPGAIGATAKNGDLTLAGTVKYLSRRAVAEVAVIGLTCAGSVRDGIKVVNDSDAADVNPDIKAARDSHMVGRDRRRAQARVCGNAVAFGGCIRTHAVAAADSGGRSLTLQGGLRLRVGSLTAMSLHLRPGCLIVFEGLDRSGKSTQIGRLSALDWAVPGPRFAHMPSGLTDLTRSIYSLTENRRISSPLARQLLYIACQAESIGPIAEARVRHGLFLDRWWWSTVAYGWYGAGLAGSGLKESVFFGLIESIWSSQQADVVFLFMTPHESDSLNRDEVRSGYAALAAEYEAITVAVPPVGTEETTDFILARLRIRELLA